MVKKISSVLTASFAAVTLFAAGAQAAPAGDELTTQGKGVSSTPADVTALGKGVSTAPADSVTTLGKGVG